MILFFCSKNSSQFCAQVVAVLSAMKMEMAVQAPIGGKVVKMMMTNNKQKMMMMNNK